RSADRGRSWFFLRNLPLSQFYHVSFDMERPYNVMGGLQDNGSWVGPSQAPGGVTNAMWKSVGVGDGFYVFQHPADRDTIYSQYQGGKLLRFHKPTGEIKYIAPKPGASGPPLRFHWNAGVAMSPTDPNVLYIGGQFL
ncbi:MAG TPA: glycosyl hydrolase, partial [Solibacterales bacterium]|nr:glycosyl hydrolase [Bryobacterales bacterium]